MTRSVIHLRVSRGELHAECRAGSAVQWSATASYSDPTDLEEAVAALASAGEVPAGAAMQVGFTTPLLQVRRLEALPPLGGVQLAQLVAHAPARYFRKNGKPLLTDAAWTSRDRQIATAVAIESPYAEAVLAGARAAGFRVAAMGPLADGTLPPLTLFPVGEREARRLGKRRSLLRWGVAAAVAWAGFGAIVVGRTMLELARTRRALTELGPTLDAVSVARSRMDGAIAGIAAVGAPAEVRLGPAFTLTRTASALPDSAWLLDAQVEGDGAGMLTGMAPRPTTVLARIDRAAVVAHPRLEQSGLNEGVAGRQVGRFVIRFGAEEAP